jgi:hypothetical protein
MQEIYLGDGLSAKVSDCDHGWLREMGTWRLHLGSASGKPYAIVSSARRGHRFMQRVITRCPTAYQVDHENGDGLDNQRPNLRICTYAQNQANRAGWAISGYKGVYRQGASCRARMMINGEQIHLGTFRTEIEAAAAYDDKAFELFGEFARLNLPDRYPRPDHDRVFHLPPEFSHA